MIQFSIPAKTLIVAVTLAASSVLAAELAIQEVETRTLQVSDTLVFWPSGTVVNGWPFIGMAHTEWNAYASEWNPITEGETFSDLYQAVPEPSTFALSSGMLAFAWIMIRRR